MKGYSNLVTKVKKNKIKSFRIKENRIEIWDHVEHEKIRNYLPDKHILSHNHEASWISAWKKEKYSVSKCLQIFTIDSILDSTHPAKALWVLM